MNEFTFLALAALPLAPLSALHAADVANLRCEFRVNPLGIDITGNKQAASPKAAFGKSC